MNYNDLYSWISRLQMLIIVCWSTNDLYTLKIKLEKDYMIIVIWWLDFYNPTNILTTIQL